MLGTTKIKASHAWLRPASENVKSHPGSPKNTFPKERRICVPRRGHEVMMRVVLANEYLFCKPPNPDAALRKLSK